MKRVGIIGGIGPESTVEYYQYIIAGYRERTNDGSYPSIVVNSVDLDRLVRWINADDMNPFTDYLVSEVERLERAGASVVETKEGANLTLTILRDPEGNPFCIG